MRYKEFVAVLVLCCAGGCSKNGNPVINSNNSAPIIQSVTFNPDTVIAGKSCLVQCIAVDPDSDNLSYHWESVGTMAGSGSKRIFSPGACCGAPWLVITVEDGKGGITDSAVTVPFKYE
jgi:hypothetical protein